MEAQVDEPDALFIIFYQLYMFTVMILSEDQ